MEIIDEFLLNEIAKKAMDFPRLRMNYNFHQSLEDKCRNPPCERKVISI